jgi:hypothetical protein
MRITRTLKRMTVGALVAGGLAVSGLGHTGVIAHADDTFAPHHWCPGQRTDPPTGPGQPGPVNPAWLRKESVVHCHNFSGSSARRAPPPTRNAAHPQ